MHAGLPRCTLRLRLCLADALLRQQRGGQLDEARLARVVQRRVAVAVRGTGFGARGQQPLGRRAVSRRSREVERRRAARVWRVDA